MSWRYSTSLPAVLRNQLGYAATDLMVRPLVKALNELRSEWRLKPVRRLDACFSPFAIVAQQPAAFDYPRRELPDCFHSTGPFHDRRVRPPVPFPFEQLNGKPLIYASMGTLQNRLEWVFSEIARACTGLDAQLVISLGGGKDPAQIGPLPGNPLVVRYAPQTAMLPVPLFPRGTRSLCRENSGRLHPEGPASPVTPHPLFFNHFPINHLQLISPPCSLPFWSPL
jgi:hypothetical protein